MYADMQKCHKAAHKNIKNNFLRLGVTRFGTSKGIRIVEDTEA